MNPYGYQGGGEDIAAAMGAYFACFAGVMIIMTVLYLWLFYRIFQKAGYNGWMTLLNLIPYVGTIVVIFMLAFGDWPVTHAMRPGVGMQPTPPTPPYQPPYAPPPGQ